LKLEAVMVTDVGVVRDHNEDSAHVDPARRFFIVADGMGGHAAGEVASAMAVESVTRSLDGAGPVIEAFAARPSDTTRRALVQLLQGAVLSAHQAVFQRGARESDKAGMGTTLDVVLVAGSEAFVAHVGDSRTYLIRDGKAAQLTTDHTVAEVLVIEGKLTIEEALVSPYRTVLVNAIGVAADVGVEMAHLQLRQGDKLLLCSDGLHDYFIAEQEIADTLAEGQAEATLGAMVEIAKERGGHDNITGVVVSVVELSDSVPASVHDDETAPVPGEGDDQAAFDAEERTENIAPRELDTLGLEPLRPERPAPADDPRARATAPMLVVTPPGSQARGMDATDPGIEAPPPSGRALEDLDGDDDAAAGADALRGAGGDEPTLPTPVPYETTAHRRSMERAATMPPPVADGDLMAPQGPPAMPGDEGGLAARLAAHEPGGGERAQDARDGGRAQAGGAEPDDRDDAVPTDSLALGDTGPLPKVDGDAGC
jgi:serine/threonine protein phosphatase PrpC